jgi:ABC-type multidrug transport system ATPase subunit
MTIMNKGQILKTGTPKDLISKLENKIWSKSIKTGDLESYQNNYNVISQQLIERKLYITVYSEEQPSDFEATIPLLEHVYFYTLTQTNKS